MTNPLRVEEAVHFRRAGKGGRILVASGSPATTPAPGRRPRVARLMALAIKFDGLVRNGEVKDYADLARLGQVTRARITQIMNLLQLAPDIQEQLLFLPPVQFGRDPISLRELQSICLTFDWKNQQKAWSALQRR